MDLRVKINTLYSKMVQLVEADSASWHTIMPAFKLAIDQVMMTTDVDDVYLISHLSILLEALYQQSSLSPDFKSEILALRLDRWANHFGTPTVTFLLTHEQRIHDTVMFFEKKNISELHLQPWRIEKNDELVIDHCNQVVVNPKKLYDVPSPEADEQTGKFIKTHNPTGGFTTTPCDPVSQQFIENVAEIASKNGSVLEIGAAFGAASLQASAKGVRVFCNDISTRNLAVVHRRYNSNIAEDSLTGDDEKLILVPGALPEELRNLPKNYFDAILVCRVLHFFSGEKIETSLIQLSQNLKKGGKLFIVCETPYLKNWQQFLPEFNKRVEAGVKWPGEITNPAEYESSGRSALLPKFVHWITKEVLAKSLSRIGLEVENLSYINRRGQFPDDLLLDGRESVGAVATKHY